MVALSGLPVTRRSASVDRGAWERGSFEATRRGPPRVAAARRSLSPDDGSDSVAAGSRPDWCGPLIRGLMIGLPLALIFAVLFASADPIFRRGVDDLLGLADRSRRRCRGASCSSFACAWLAAGTAVGRGGRDPRRSNAARRSARPRGLGARRSPALGSGPPRRWSSSPSSTWSSALFVGLQIAYLFGGLDTLAAVGMTYSDYARRGFFELVAAACLAGAVVVALETTSSGGAAVPRRRCSGCVGLTGDRPRLRRRCAPALPGRVRLDGAAAVRLRRDHRAGSGARRHGRSLVSGERIRWLGHALAVIGVVALVGLNAGRPAAFVAERNIERVIDPSLVPPDGHAGLDADYLRVLPDDAIPVLVAALPRLPEPDATPGPLPPRDSAGPSWRPIPRSRRRPPGTSVANGRGTALETRPMSRPALRLGRVSLCVALPFEPPIEPMLAKAVRCAAERRRLAVRAQVGRLPGARLP